ncbi:MAG: hypothetical protein II735_02200 [Clostridia bacterium]|nr:hypothetical protein [Clostridia bacterium]
MTHEKYYRRWAAEYERSAEVIKGNIDKLKEKAKTAKYGELQSIGNDISTLTASLYDCRGIAQELLKKAERERRKAAAV